MTKRSIVYIDGFNLYYGAMKDSSCKWLNLQTYFERLRQDDNVQKIWYFTARVHGAAASRQQPYLEALSTLPKVEIKYGLFKDKTQKCKVASCTLPASQKKYRTHLRSRAYATSLLGVLGFIRFGIQNPMIL